jgi:nucleoside-diphosphate-sugar epimerase
VRRALVSGAGGFVGGHLVRRLVDDGWWVRGVDRAERLYGPSPAHEYLVLDLRDPADAARAFAGGFDEVYQLAADMGGMEFIEAAEYDILQNNARINLNMVAAASAAGVGRYFFSSSACVYRDMVDGEPPLDEDAVYPALPDNEYGWEKLYTERVVMAAAKKHGFDARVARFENCFGPEGAWRGGREKAPAALCRKVAEAVDGGVIEVFGGGETTRSFIFVDDLVDAAFILMRSSEDRPTNIGIEERVKIRELVDVIADVAGKRIDVRPVDGPLGVAARSLSHERMRALGWRPRHTLREGIARTYPWIAERVSEFARSDV